MTPKPQTLKHIHEEQMRMSRGAAMRAESDNRDSFPDMEYQGNITKKLNQTQQNLGGLEEAIMHLEKVLGPILRPQTTEKSPGMAEPAMDRSGMADELDRLGVLIEQARIAVNSLRERVDI